MTNTKWKECNGFNTSYGDLIDQYSESIFIKNQDGKFIAFDHKNDTKSPEFDFCKDLEIWLNNAN